MDPNSENDKQVDQNNFYDSEEEIYREIAVPGSGAAAVEPPYVP